MQWDLCQNEFNGKITEMEKNLELLYDKALQFTQMRLRMLLILCVHFIMFVAVLDSYCFLFQPIKNQKASCMIYLEELLGQSMFLFDKQSLKTV